MNILITNIELSKPGGTVTYVLDLASTLTLRGHTVEVFSYKIGSIAGVLKSAGINVVTNVKKLRNIPDIIHSHHHPTTIDVIKKFNNTPVIFFLHDRTSPLDHPPKCPQILKYVAVDYNCLDRLRSENIDTADTFVIHNWVDTNKFRLREHFSDMPAKALVFSNYATPNNFYKIIKDACKLSGIELNVLGRGMGTQVNNPEDHLLKYDLVFAKAKAAIEALSTGAAVITCDFSGLGDMVTQSNIREIIKYNFGMKSLTKPITVDLIIEEIKKFNRDQNKLNAILIREEASLDRVINSLMDLYKNTIKLYNEGQRGQAPDMSSEERRALNLKIYFFMGQNPVLKYIQKGWLLAYWKIKGRVQNLSKYV